jgi:hypothetical protein
MGQKVTNEMLAAAMKKAVHTGLVPKYANEENYIKNYEAMEQCIIDAIDDDKKAIAENDSDK